MASGTWGTGFWGQNQWNDSADPTFTVTGIALTASLGDETTVGEINTGWGRAGWNDFAWGIAGNLIAPGQALTGALGTAVASIDVSTGPSTNNNQLITTTLNSVTLDIVGKVFPVGIGMTSALGTADAGPDAMATGNQATLSLGTVEAFNQTGWGRQQWNVNAWGVEGQFANVDVTGIAMTADEGTLLFAGDANVSLTGFALTANEGTADAAPDAEVTGLELSASLGSVSLTGSASVSLTGFALTNALGTAVLDANTIGAPSGFALTMQEGDPTNKVSVDVSLTGLDLTGSLGNVYNLIWNEVNTGTTVTWREVDTAA